MRQPRSSVSLLAVLAIVGGILEFFGGLVLLFGGGLADAVGSPEGTVAFILGAAMFGLGFTSFVVGYGFWRHHSWAWAGAFVVYGFGLVVNISSVVVAGANPLSVVLPIALAAAVMWYLLQPATKTAVRSTTRVPAKA